MLSRSAKQDGYWDALLRRKSNSLVCPYFCIRFLGAQARMIRSLALLFLLLGGDDLLVNELKQLNNLVPKLSQKGIAEDL